MKKIKIALICHFSNPIVREHLEFERWSMAIFIKNLFGKAENRPRYSDLASWNTNFIDNFRNRKDVELVVISAHAGLRKTVEHFYHNRVSYYFVKCDLALHLKKLIHNVQLWHFMNPIRPIIRKIVKSEKPDIIALMGAENAYFSGSVLGLKKDFPVIVKTQTIYNNPERKTHMSFDNYNAYVEKLIFDRIKYVSVGTKMHYDLYKTFCSDSYNFRWPLGTTYPRVNVVEKEYDFVNFANTMTPAKGFTDVIKALSIVKNTYPTIKLNLIGTPSIEDKAIYEKLIAENNLENNVVFTPFFTKQEDMFQQLQKSYFAVLPYKLDYISSTTYQAMYYGLPVIVYKTPGTPTLNNKKPCVLISNMNDIESLASNMILLKENPLLAAKLKENAKKTIEERNDGNLISENLMQVFVAVIENLKYGTPIPEMLMYRPV